MDDEIDSLLIDVRANTRGFESDIQAMRDTFDGTLVAGFERAGNVLEQGLETAIRKGGLGFEDLQRIAARSFDQIIAQAAKFGVSLLFGGNSSSGIAGLLGSFAGIFGLPGRATGGPVAPGSAYLVGERGPEVFVPTSAGRIEAPQAPGRDVRVEAQQPGKPREVRVAIQLASPRGTEAPVALRRSARQVASSVRRALEG